MNALVVGEEIPRCKDGNPCPAIGALWPTLKALDMKQLALDTGVSNLMAAIKRVDEDIVALRGYLGGIASQVQTILVAVDGIASTTSEIVRPLNIKRKAEPMEITKGYKTTEFWLGIAAVVISAVLAAGIVPDGSLVGKLIGIASIVLTSLGYTVSRGIVKSSASKAASIAAAASLLSNPSEPTKQ